MTKHLALPEQPSATQLLTRIVESPQLLAEIRTLPAPVLARLIDVVGLEDAGEIIAFATTEQLAQVFDDDVWRSEAPGEDERFDAERFSLWLEVMLEAGDHFVATKLAELPRDLVTLALHRQMLVLESDALVAMLHVPDKTSEAIENALSNSVCEELGPYQLVARRPDGWDTVFAALLALDAEHHDLLLAILERCCQMSNEVIDDNGGLYEVLTSAEMLESDVAGEREDRRAAVGFISPSSATAFLRLARRGPSADRDALTRAYFRRLGEEPTPKAAARPPAEPERHDLLALLRESGAIEKGEAPRRLAGPDEEKADEILLVHALRNLADTDPEIFVERSQELAYLANVLGAACSHRAAGLRPVDAVRVAMAACNLGLESTAGADPAALSRHRADDLFRIAWKRLEAEVIRPAADAAEHGLRRAAKSAPADEAADLLRAAARVRAAANAGVAWRARSEVELLYGSLDAPLVEELLGLIDECPALPSGRFVATAADLRDVSTTLARVRAASY